MTTEQKKEYQEFLDQKKQQRVESGFVVTDEQLNPALFPFQKYCVKRALAVGKFALFEDCGLGKTIQQLEWAQTVCEKIDKPVLILAPLAVISQTIKEGEKFGYVVKEIGDMYYQQDMETGIYITNYISRTWRRASTSPTTTTWSTSKPITLAAWCSMSPPS